MKKSPLYFSNLSKSSMAGILEIFCFNNLLKYLSIVGLKILKIMKPLYDSCDITKVAINS
jgi:hypothetical protein